MWYPSFPDVLHLHDRICAVQEVDARVREMEAIDEAILAPQHAKPEGDAYEDRMPGPIARKCTALLVPLITRHPFENCNDRVAYSTAQRFTDRNGYVFGVSLSDARPVFEHMRHEEEIAWDSIVSWIESNLKSRFDKTRRERIFWALNALAETKEYLEDIPGLHEDIERLDNVGYLISQQMAVLFRIDDEERQNLQNRYPAFWDAWQDALPSNP